MPAVLGRHCQAGLRTHERLVLHPRLVVSLDRHRSPDGWVAAADRLAEQHAPERVDRLADEGRLRIDDRIVHFVLDHDRLGGEPRRDRVVCRYRGDRLTRVPDHVGGEHRLIRVLETVRLASRHVVGRRALRGPPGCARHRRCRRGRWSQTGAVIAAGGPSSMPSDSRSDEKANSPLTFGRPSGLRTLWPRPRRAARPASTAPSVSSVVMVGAPPVRPSLRRVSGRSPCTGTGSRRSLRGLRALWDQGCG